MLFPEAHDHPAFKSWLTNTLEPLCVILLLAGCRLLLMTDVTPTQRSWATISLRS